MRQCISWLNESKYIPPLSPACKMCAEGAKLVILATGLCSSDCYYCPLSFKKTGHDCVYADEWELLNEKDTEKLILEAEYIEATGAGITGGDTILVWERVRHYITLLKESFGSRFHIHLYTSGLFNSDKLPLLVAAGLDEIRFHPPVKFWNNMESSPYTEIIQDVMDLSADIAIEVPVIPDTETELFSLIQWAAEKKIKWVNLNELEYSERNYKGLNMKGFHMKNELSAAVNGSQDIANSLLNKVSLNDLDIGVHYCSVSFKDGIQLRNRIQRRAKNVVKSFEAMSDEGTLLKGVICSSRLSLQQIQQLLKDDFQIPLKYFLIDQEKHRIEIAAWILEGIAQDLQDRGCECFLVEEYPTADRLEVERIPLPLEN